jgi:N-acetyl-gamma-glutamyl-phosphate reductase
MKGRLFKAFKQLQPGFDKEFNFVPIRGNHTRGIFVSAYIQFEGILEYAKDLYRKFMLIIRLCFWQKKIRPLNK